MTYKVIVVDCGGPGFVAPHMPDILHIPNQHNRFSPAECYQRGLELSTEDVLIYVHDDVTIHEEDWSEPRGPLLHSFYSKNVAAVGLGGATGLGNSDLYRKPFNIWNMARRGYASNQTDAEVHGERFTGLRRVAVLDAFFMAIRRDFLLNCGGWPTTHLTHHCLDLWLACEAARRGKEIWTVGVGCTHYGGGSSTKPTYKAAPWLQGASLENDHIIPHEWLYSEYRDVLPLEAKK